MTNSTTNTDLTIDEPMKNYDLYSDSTTNVNWTRQIDFDALER